MISIGHKMKFAGYADRNVDSLWVLAKGEPVRVVALEADYGARVCGLDSSGRPARARTEWVWLEELESWWGDGDQPTCRVSRRQVAAILADPSSKMFADLRDRAAYMYVTQCYPTHLRPFFTGALTEMRRYASRTAGGQGPAFELTFVHQLELDDHPMVVRVREMAAEGWTVNDPIRETARHSFQKIHLSLGDERRTVRTSGEVVLGWQLPKRRA